MSGRYTRGSSIRSVADFGVLDNIDRLIEQQKYEALWGQTQLHVACRDGDLVVVRELLKEEAVDIGAQNDHGHTALHCAAASGHESLIRELLRHLKDRTKLVRIVNIGNVLGETALHLAALNGHVNIVRLLLNKGAKVNARKLKDGQTPIHYSAYHGHVEVASLLHEWGATLTPTADSGLSPLVIAKTLKRTSFEIFLQQRILGAGYFNKLWVAASFGSLPELERLVLQGGECFVRCQCTGEGGNTLLHLVASKGFIPLAVILEQHGADRTQQNNNGMTPLDLAKEKGMTAMITYLESQTLKTGNQLPYRLSDLSRRQPGQNRNIRNGAYLLTATEDGNLEEVKFEIKMGVDPNWQNQQGESALHIACRHGHPEIVQRLLDEGAKPNLQTHQGTTPLHYAIDNGNVTLIALLLEKGADSGLQDAAGITPEEIASQSESSPIRAYFRSLHPKEEPVTTSESTEAEDDCNDNKKLPAVPIFWSCHACTFAENMEGFLACSICQSPRPKEQEEEDLTVNESVIWTCRRCTFAENPPGAENCIVCCAASSTDTAVGDNDSGARSSWTCTTCFCPNNHIDMLRCMSCCRHRSEKLLQSEEHTADEMDPSTSCKSIGATDDEEVEEGVDSQLLGFGGGQEETEVSSEATTNTAQEGGKGSSLKEDDLKDKVEASVVSSQIIEEPDSKSDQGEEESKSQVFYSVQYGGSRGTITINSLGLGFEASVEQHRSWFWEDIDSLDITESSKELSLLLKCKSEEACIGVEYGSAQKLCREAKKKLALSNIHKYPTPTKQKQDELVVPRVHNVACANRPEFMGVSVHHLQNHFLADVEATEGLTKRSKFYELENLRKNMGFVRQKGQFTKCPVDGQPGAAYVHCLDGDDHVGPATHMLSWTWSYSVEDLVDTLVDHCQERQLDPRRVYVWICCLCMNQHRIAEARNASTVDFENEFRRRVHGIGRILVMMAPWGSPSNLARVWCVYEIHQALQDGCDLTIVMPPRERDRMAVQLFSMFGRRPGERGIDSLYKALDQVDVEKAQASVEEDRTRILHLVREKVGFQTFNSRVRERLRQWVRDSIDHFVDERTQALESADGNHNDQIAHASFCKQVGEVFEQYGDFDASLAMHRHCLCIRESVLGSNSLDTAESCIDLGKALSSLGHVDQAMEMYRRAAVIYEQVLGSNHLQTAGVYYHLGRLHLEINDIQNALALMRKCLSIRAVTLGRHRDTAMAYCHLGLLLAKNGEAEEGLLLARKAQEIVEECVGPTHPDTAFCYSSLASLVRDRDPQAALLHLLHCRDIQERLLGEGHIALATTYTQIGSMMRSLGRLEESQQVFQRALAIAESASASQPNSPFIAGCYANLSIAALVLGEHDVCARMHEEALSSLRMFESPKKGCQGLVSVYDTVGEEMMNSGDNDDNAVLVYRQSLSVREALLSKLDAELAVGHEAIGLALYSKGDYEAALKEYEESLSIRESTLDEQSPDRLATVEMVETIRLKIEKEKSLLSGDVDC